MSYQSPFHMMMRDMYKKKQVADDKRRHHIQNVEGKLFHQTTHHTTPNMADAYSKVVNSDYEPSEEEINYRQQNTSGFVPH